MGDTGQRADTDLDHLHTTADLLARIREGDHCARDLLVGRFLPRLRVWAHGRVPSRLHSLHDTDDLVQVTLLKALEKVKTFEPHHRGSFLAYLRRILINEIRSLIRGADRKPSLVAIDDRIPQDDPSPLEKAIGAEMLEAYENALAKLPDRKQEAVFLRIEMGCTHEEVAAELGLPSADAARMLVARALVNLSEAMRGRR